MQLHGQPARTIDPLAVHCGGQATVLDSLVRTMLSQNTTDVTSMRAFTTLKERFPTWPAALAAPAEELEDAIRVGGLAAIKVARIQALLQALVEERGSCSLEWLREEPDAAVKAFLSRFKGVGPKTVSCVMLFCLQRPDFAVDTHVWHITQQLGWCPTGCSREQAYEHLNCLVPGKKGALCSRPGCGGWYAVGMPSGEMGARCAAFYLGPPAACAADDVKHDLHVLLVSHGKGCAACSKTGRGDKGCPIAELKRPRAGKAGKAKASAAAKAKRPGPAAVVVSKAEVKEEPAEGQRAKVKAEPAAAARAKLEAAVKVEDSGTASAVAIKREPSPAAMPAKKHRKR